MLRTFKVRPEPRPGHLCGKVPVKNRRDTLQDVITFLRFPDHGMELRFGSHR